MTDDDESDTAKRNTATNLAMAFLIAGSLGLFAGGWLATLGSIAAGGCLVGYLGITLGESLYQRDEPKSTDQSMDATASPTPGLDMSPSPPGKSWVASLDTPRKASRYR